PGRLALEFALAERAALSACARAASSVQRHSMGACNDFAGIAIPIQKPWTRSERASAGEKPSTSQRPDTRTLPVSHGKAGERSSRAKRRPWRRHEEPTLKTSATARGRLLPEPGRSLGAVICAPRRRTC